MRPLTDALPKPLLSVGGSPLIDYHLQALTRAGISEVVVNVAWQKQKLVEHLAAISVSGLQVHISDEGDSALETGGGVFRALGQLGREPFWLVNGDVYAQFDFASAELGQGRLAHLLLVPNPEHNPRGDFSLCEGAVANAGNAMLTYSGIAILHPDLFAGCEDGVFPLAPLLRRAAEVEKVSGEILHGDWCDVGTPERLAQLDERLRSQSVTSRSS